MSTHHAGVWNLLGGVELPARASDFVPGAHIAAAHHPHQADVVGIALRRAGFEIRDTIVWRTSNGHYLITLARVPLDGTVARNVLTHGAGGLNIDACRVPLGDADKAASEAKNNHSRFNSGPREHKGIYGPDTTPRKDWSGDAGRFPTNLIFQHGPTCTVVGTATVKGDARATTHTPGTRPGGFLDVGADKGEGTPNARLYGDAQIAVFDCSPTCPVKDLDERSGERRAGVFPPARGASKTVNFGHTGPTEGGYRLMGDTGGASRYFPRFTDTQGVWAWLSVLVTPPNGSLHTHNCV